MNHKFQEIKKKVKRISKYSLPISPNRRGACIRCGECCKLVFKCPFLFYDEEGLAHCMIYKIRPLGCRKYPRTSEDWVTQKSCGFFFIKNDFNNKEQIKFFPKLKNGSRKILLKYYLKKAFNFILFFKLWH